MGELGAGFKVSKFRSNERVVLSGVSDSRSEAGTQSKDPFHR